jgi:pyridoxine 5-phosphate synthase
VVTERLLVSILDGKFGKKLLTELNINIDHVATIRNARGGIEPDPIEAALLAEKAGAKGIVCHLREDRRHIIDDDVVRLKKAISGRLDLEMAVADDIIAFAKKVKPELITLVPEKREELTTEGGLNVFDLKNRLEILIEDMHHNGILVSLFIEPDRKSIELSKEIGADLVEIHTGKYANHYKSEQFDDLLAEILDSAKFAKNLGLRVAAGHGLNYENTAPIAAIEEIDELSIGHSVISRSLFTGIEKATQDMLKIIKESRPK